MSLELGINKETKRPIYLKEQDRLLNNMVIGPIGSGKTLFLLNGIHQDVKEIAKQKIGGLSVFDSEGSLSGRIQSIAQKEGVEQVTIIDPTNENTLRFNPLSGEYDDVLKAVLIMLEDYFVTLDGEQAKVQKEALKHILFAIKHSNQHIIGLHTIKYCVQSPEFLIKLLTRSLGLINTEEYQEKFKSYQVELKKWMKKTVGITIQRGKVKYYFKDPQQLMELGAFLQDVAENEYVNKLFTTSPTNELDFGELMERGGLLLVSVPKGIVGEPHTSMIGKYILSRLEQAAFRRPYDVSSLHHIVIDDAVSFLYRDFTHLLDQSRKHHVSVTIADQTLKRVEIKHGEGMVHRLMVSLRNKFVFGGISIYDARLLSPAINEGVRGEMELTSKDLIIQDAFVCMAKLIQDSYSLPAKEIKIHYSDARI